MKKFIALVLSLVMALSLCAPAWGAEITTLDGLKTATGEINVTQTIVINEEVSLTNLTITANVVDAFKVVNGGKLTLGEGVTVTSDEGAVFYVNGGNIVIDGAEVTADSEKYALAYLDNGGSITVNSGLLSHNGNDAHAIEVAATGCTANVTGGEVYSAEGVAIGITSTTGGTINISGGTVSTGAVDTFAAVYGYSGTINVTGGTIGSANTTPALLASSNSCDPATVNVSGGTIDSVGVENDADADDVAITGGAFEVLPKNYIVDGYAAVQYEENGKYIVEKVFSVFFDANGGTGTMNPVTRAGSGEYVLPACGFTAPEGMQFKAWSVNGETKTVGGVITISDDVTVIAVWEDVPVAEKPVAKIGDVEYTSFQDAVNAVKNNETITILFVGDYSATVKEVKTFTVEFEDGITGGNVHISAVGGLKISLDKSTYIVEKLASDTDLPSGGDDDPKPDEDKPVVVPPVADATVDAEVKVEDVKESSIVFNEGFTQDDIDNATEEISTEFAITVASPIGIPADVQTELSDADDVICLDIDLHLFVGGDHVGNITELRQKVEVRIPASVLKGFTPVADGYTRTYYVVHHHDTGVEVLEAKLDGDELVIYSDKFSPYYVAYEDVATPTNYPSFYWPVVGGTTTPDKEVVSADTFDGGIALYVGVTILGVTGSAWLAKKKD